MEISERTKSLKMEQSFVVLAGVNKLIKEGKDIVNFCIGQPDFNTPENAKDAAIKAIKENQTGYTASAGISELREAAAEYFSRTRKIVVTPEEVVIATGSKPFIMYTVASLTDHGKKQEVIYLSPHFPVYEYQTKAQGAVGRPLPLLEKNGFKFDIEKLARKVNKNSRLLILNSPHNPTGMVLNKQELEEIAKIVLRYNDLYVLSDEVYSQIVYDREFFSIASIPGMQERAIIVDSMSKNYAMTGWRIGFAANKKLAPFLEKWVNNDSACADQVAQRAAVEALTGPQGCVEEMTKTFKERRDLVVRGLNQIRGIRCLNPGGAFYVWPNVTEACRIVGAKDAEDFRKRLLDAGVAVLADIHFGRRIRGEGYHIRMSYAASNEKIGEGLRRIKAYIESF